MKSVKAFQNSCIPPSQLNLIFQSRTVWRDLSTWLRAYLASKHGGLGDKEAIREKISEVLLKFSNILSLIFGESYADEYIALLNNYINTLDLLIDAQIQGDADAVNKHTKELYESADQIASFLSKINPYWVESEWKSLLYQFSEKTIDESTTFQNKEFKENVDVFDRILNLTSLIGDYYSQGLLNYLNFSSK